MSAKRQLEERAHWLAPEDLVARLELTRGMTVAETGSQPGYYSAVLARQVGPQGKVFAVGASTPAAAPANLEAVAGSPWETNLPDESCDAVVMADLLNEVADRRRVLAEAKRILKPGGTLVLFEWHPEAPAPPGPPLDRRISLQDLLCIVERESWSLTKTCQDWSDGYLLVFEPTDETVQS